jgi:hypothetical protein
MSKPALMSTINLIPVSAEFGTMSISVSAAFPLLPILHVLALLTYFLVLDHAFDSIFLGAFLGLSDQHIASHSAPLSIYNSQTVPNLVQNGLLNGNDAHSFQESSFVPGALNLITIRLWVNRMAPKVPMRRQRANGW